MAVPDGVSGRGKTNFDMLKFTLACDEEKRPDLRLGNAFQLPGTNLVIFLEALCAQINLFWHPG